MKLFPDGYNYDDIYEPDYFQGEFEDGKVSYVKLIPIDPGFERSRE